MHSSRPFLAIALAASTLACSCGGPVVITNPTDRAVELMVTPVRADPNERDCDCIRGYDLSKFGLVATADPGALAGATWTTLDSTAFRWDTTGFLPTLSVVLSLPAGSSLRIGRSSYDCSGGVIHEDLPAEVVIVDGDWALRMDPIGFADRARRTKQYFLLYEVGSTVDARSR